MQIRGMWMTQNQFTYNSTLDKAQYFTQAALREWRIIGVTACERNKRLLFLSQDVSHHKPLESL